jgi:hypothetical protein
MSYEEIEENPEDGTSGLTSASQMLDSTSAEMSSEIETTGVDSNHRVSIRVPIKTTTPRRIDSQIPNDEFEEALEKAFEEYDELLRRLAG